MKNSQDSVIHFRGLNAMRFIAALCIIVYHSTLTFHASWYKPFREFMHNLPLGVDLFFMISGFLIVYLLLQEKLHHKRIDIPKFYIRRILRIFPLYYLIIGIAFLKYGNDSTVNFSKHLYFWGNFQLIETGNWTVAPLNPLWSLCIEEHFYLVIPALLFFVPLRYVPYLFGAIMLLSIGFRAYISLTIQYNWMHIYAHTLSRCDFLAVGGLLAYHYQKKPGNFSIRPLYVLFSGIYLVILMSIVDSFDYSSLMFSVFKKYLFLGPLAIIFVGVVLSSHTNSVLEWLKNNKYIDYLGKISFGLYMYHSFISIKLESAFLKSSVTIILTILIAAISYELFEKQILKIKARFEVLKTKN